MGMNTKQFFLLLIAFTFSVNTFSQIKKGNVLISLDGNYQKTGSAIGVTTNNFSSYGPSLALGISAGVMFSDNWAIGVGLDYGRNKITTVNELVYAAQHIQVESMDTKENIYAPNIFISYYYNIAGKLYLSTSLKFSAGFAKQVSESFIASMYIPDVEPGTITTIDDRYDRNMSFKHTSDIEFGNITLYPELVYFISNRIGFHLGLGGISYTMPDWETKDSQWLVNFNPQYWQLGIKIKL